jgi:hypothetical protein
MRLGRRAITALCLAATIVWASAASARTERFRWTQASTPAVDNFKLYWGSASGSYASSLSLGVPAKDSTGAYYYDLVVPDSTTVYVTVTAWSSGLESLKSNEVTRAGISGGGTTTPPPTSTGAQSAIVGFALWNAQNDTVVDTSFSNGETIPDAIRACAAIEIKANAYLQAAGPGSIKKVLDGQDVGCSGSGAKVENNAPYAWEDDAGASAFPCAASLAVAGSHTLTVTPYDGDNCTGLVGTSKSLSFTVNAATAAPPSSTLGAPGQPYIVP